MSRPTKSAKTITSNISAKDLEKRNILEDKLKGNDNEIKPPKYLSKTQKNIFKYIVKELKSSEILGNLDVYILTMCSIAIDRLEKIETNINENELLLYDSKLMASKEKYSKDLYRCCNELSLSPQARAKLANVNLQAKEDDPLLKVLTESED